MEMHQLRYVAAIARTGTFSRAAEKCHVAQPSLSQQVQKLEDELGERLFERTRREARLTEYGKLFLTRALRILEEAEAARREAAETSGLLRGRVAIGVLPTIAPYFLPSVLSDFTREHPAVQILVQEEMTSQLLAKVLSYETELALVSLPLDEPRLDVRPLCMDEMFLALPPGHRLAPKRQVTGADLQGESLIVMKEGHCLGEQVLNFCDRRGIQPRITFQSAQLETVQALVRSGLGLSLVPAMALKTEAADAPIYRPFKAPKPQRQIVAISARERQLSRAAAALLQTLLAHTTPAKSAKRSPADVVQPAAPPRH